ncbi:MAG: cytosine deaminase, partial [Candidatus Auribacterota bacterium]|nr:cytosine deaminase [Candidatus Auribacterota bacterium]
MMDILIKNARLRKKNGNWDIAVSGGIIEKIARRINARPRKKINAGGKLVTESFVNAHLHLCKV